MLFPLPETSPRNLRLPQPAVRRKKLLLLSVSAGAGHTRAAEAIRQHAVSHHGDAEAIHLDVMDFVPRIFRKLYTDFYITLVNRFPAAWGYLYRSTDGASPDSLSQILRRTVERLNTGALRRKIAAIQPDAIVCTHFLPAEMLAHMTLGCRLSCPVWVQVTDFDLHRLWVHDGIAGYFAANEEVAFRMRARGAAADAIRVTGIPIMSSFGEVLDRGECAREIGLDSHRPTVLLMGGGAGLGRLDEVAARLLRLEEKFQLIVLAGKNRDALAALQPLVARSQGRLVAHGFTNRVERLMACADLAITKPGGLTTSECLAMRLPMILNSPIPGQEERNADFLLEQGVALKASDAVTLEYRVRHLLLHPEMLAAMREKAAAIARPSAACHVLDAVLSHQPFHEIRA
ncbi:galactosyldiacylglycerol synthase [Herbaspirillum sp. HC18]|nr:galactosyldiacylglycerol synthase [Herbaspirillum sp. HC18]